MSSLGGSEKKIYDLHWRADFLNRHLSWSVDGKRIVFPDRTSDGTNPLIELDVTTGKSRQIHVSNRFGIRSSAGLFAQREVSGLCSGSRRCGRPDPTVTTHWRFAQALPDWNGRVCKMSTWNVPFGLLTAKV